MACCTGLSSLEGLTRSVAPQVLARSSFLSSRSTAMIREALCELRRVPDRPPAGGDAAPEEADLLERRRLVDLRHRLLVQHRVLGEGAGAHEVVDRFALAV